MIARLQHPLAYGPISLVLSLAVGVAACWQPITEMIAQASVPLPPVEGTELKKKGWDFWTIEIENLSEELRQERERLRKQADLLDQRAARLASEEKEFAKLRADVEALRNEIHLKVIEISVDEAANLRKLSQTYANLSPRAVVAIVREMDDNTAVKIFSLMKPDIVGPIFEEMSRGSADGELARRAAILSEKLRLMKANKPAPTS